MLAFSLMAGVASASNLGGLMKDDYVSLRSGESHVFTALIWSTDPPAEARLSVRGPDGWIVFAQPESVMIGSGLGSEVVISPDKRQAVPVKIFVRPEGAEPGAYSIQIIASKLAGSGQVKLSQELMLNVRVDVVGGVLKSTEDVVGERSVDVLIDEAEEPVDFEEDIIEPDREAGGSGGGTVLYIDLALVGVLVVSILIYRYA